MKRITGIAMALLLVVLAAPQVRADNCKTGKDIVDTAVEAGTFKTLAAALTEAGLVDALKGEGPFTVFAPSDDAFDKLPKGTVENLLKPENRDQLIAILTYHVVAGKVMAKDAVKLSAAETLNGQRIDISAGDKGVMIDKATVTATDIEASNGVIHVIDTVLLPSTKTIVDVAGEAGKFNTLIAAVKAAGLAETLMGEGPFTVFAPTDEAFAALPGGTVESLLEKKNLGKLQMILKYHVVSGRVYSDAVLKAKEVDTLAGAPVKISLNGGKAMANDASIISTDIDAGNGVVHIIDGVLLPPSPKKN
jgi:uncharacterized surface protein with fasciclin (FAS1) repeats